MKRFLRSSVWRIHICVIASFVLLFSTVQVFSHAKRSKTDTDDLVWLAADQKLELNKVFQNYQLLDLDLKGITEAVEQTGRFTFKTEGASYQLELKPHELRAPSYRSV